MVGRDWMWPLGGAFLDGGGEGCWTDSDPGGGFTDCTLPCASDESGGDSGLRLRLTAAGFRILGADTVDLAAVDEVDV
jgi:hypothetical protein